MYFPTSVALHMLFPLPGMLFLLLASRANSYSILLNKTIYLFIHLFRLLWVLVAARGIFVAACGIFSCGMWDL